VFGFWDGELSGQPAPDDMRRGEAAIDAILDYLKAHADEWEDAACEIAGATDFDGRLLVAALRSGALRARFPRHETGIKIR
jgi:hypothetical protein